MLTIHHLNFSRSTRILWLLEELAQPYNLVKYARDENFRAPATLQKIHQLGKAPVIQDGNLVLGESAVILSYINTRYGKDRFTPEPGTADYYQHDEWLQYVESTAAFPIMATRIGAIAGGMSEGMGKFFTPLLARTLDHMTRGITGRYMLGDELMLCDIQMIYLLAIADSGGMLADHIELQNYLGRLMQRPALQKAIEIGGPMMPPKK